MTQLGVEAAYDDHVFLVGRPPIAELINFVRTMAVNGQMADQGQLAQQWRAANDHVIDLEKSEAGCADNPPLGDPPHALRPTIAKVLADPTIQRAFRLLPISCQVVELDRLVVFQKFINLAYVSKLKESLGRNPTPEQVLTLAMPVTPLHQTVQVMQNTANTYTFVCPSTDFRFLEAQLIAPDAALGFASTGYPTSILALALGFGSNLLNVIQVEDRLVLNNGSHRAYALRDLGVTHVPCVVQRVSRREELELIGGEIQQSPDRYLRNPRPPLLKDYFDERLRMIVPVYRKKRFVRVQFVVEQADMPGT